MPPEGQLGVTDRGIFSDLDHRAQLQLPPGLRAARGLVVADHQLLLVYDGEIPVKAYPLGGPATLAVGEQRLGLRPGDAAELTSKLATLDVIHGSPPGDRDGDGLPDLLDLAIGARKAALNAARYGAGYLRIAYPGGDVPREVGVCTDVVIRAARNAGIDLQLDLHRDIRRARRAYPMVKGRGDTNIDHRRVKTLLPLFRRHWDARSARIDDADDPLRAGDIVFMDTFPDRPGPDHIGIISDRHSADGLPLVINNWTDGTVTTDMDLLGWVPITHRFRAPGNRVRKPAP